MYRSNLRGRQKNLLHISLYLLGSYSSLSSLGTHQDHCSIFFPSRFLQETLWYLCNDLLSWFYLDSRSFLKVALRGLLSSFRNLPANLLWSLVLLQLLQLNFHIRNLQELPDLYSFAQLGEHVSCHIWVESCVMFLPTTCFVARELFRS